MQLDHVVLWVTDPQRSFDFYVNVAGLEPVRSEEFGNDAPGFPSVRVNSGTILDLMDRARVDGVRFATGNVADSGGTPINHVCLSMSRDEYESMMQRLATANVATYPGGERSSGAQGIASRSVYWNDPDGNVIEIRHYD